MTSTPFKVYLKEIQKNLSTGQATEQTHHSALEALLEAVGDGILATNEPSRIECGAPHYIITRTGMPVGYVEAKDVGVPVILTKQDTLTTVEIIEQFFGKTRLHQEKKVQRFQEMLYEGFDFDALYADLGLKPVGK